MIVDVIIDDKQFIKFNTLNRCFGQPFYGWFRKAAFRGNVSKFPLSKAAESEPERTSPFRPCLPLSFYCFTFRAGWVSTHHHPPPAV